MEPEKPYTPGSQPEQPVESTQPTESPVASSGDQAPTSGEQQYNPVFEDPVTWTASEYVDHGKGASWFVLFGLGLVALVGLIYFFSKDILATILVGVAGLMFGIFAARPPRVLTYVIDNHGITIGERHHPFNELKSFTLLEEGGLPSLMILPLKRFMPPITIFFDPRDEDKIIDALALHLPHEDKEPDLVDRLMSHIRF